MKPSLATSRVPRRVRIIAWCLIIAIPLYVLSSGPLYRLNHVAGVPSIGFLYSFYAPLSLLSEFCPPFRTFMGWYVIDVWNPYIPIIK